MIILRKLLHCIYTKVLKTVFFLISPDRMHNLAIRTAVLVERLPLLIRLVDAVLGAKSAKTATGLGGLKFPSKVGLSAGFDKNGQIVPIMGAIGCGFVTIGSITLKPRDGNPRPWFFRLPKTKSLVVHAGLANMGVERVIKNLQTSRADKNKTPIIASVALVASSEKQSVSEIIDEALLCADKIEKSKLVNVIEFNISCPNVRNDKLFSVPANLKKLLVEVDSRGYKLPLAIKMPLLHDNQHFDRLVEIVNTSSISGLTIANLEKDRDMVSNLIKDKFPIDTKGGISGSVTKHHNLKTISRVRRKFGSRFFIIGVGGIFNVEDANDYISAGSDVVGMITGIIFEGPQVVGEIADGIN